MTKDHPHYRMNGKRYEIASHRSAAKFADLMKWQLNGQRALANATHPPPPPGLNILTDPFLPERASPVQGLGVALAARSIDPTRFIVPDVGQSIAIP